MWAAIAAALAAVLALAACCLVAGHLAAAVTARTVRRAFPPSAGPVLLVTAHPDDETMFFAPTLMALLEQGVRAHILCLSTGNYRGNGATRAKELLCAARHLGIDRDAVTCLDDSRLQDGPHAWSADAAARAIERHLKKHSHLSHAAVLTFDAYGVSGHPNHISASEAVRQLVKRSVIDARRAWQLDSMPLCRKYLGVVDTLLWLAEARRDGNYRLFIRRQSHAAVHAAMCAHATQYVWYRRLYVIFSRYVTLNSFSPLCG